MANHAPKDHPKEDGGDYSRWYRLPSWMKANRFFKKDLVNGGPMHEVSPEHANLVSSQVYYNPEEDQTYHYPIIDIDMPAALLNSSTPGHHHLFIDKLLSEEQYDKLLRVLVEVGIVQKGILELQWEQDKMTCARMPGIVKTFSSMSSGGVMPKSATINGATINFGLNPKKNKAKLSDETKNLLSKVQPAPSTMVNLPSGQKYSMGGLVSKSDMTAQLNLNTSHLTAEEKKSFEALNLLTNHHLQVVEKIARVASETGQDFIEVMDAYNSLVAKTTSQSDKTDPPDLSPF